MRYKLTTVEGAILFTDDSAYYLRGIRDGALLSGLASKQIYQVARVEEIR